MKRPIAGESIARFVYEPGEIDPYIDALIAERDRLREALEYCLEDLEWGRKNCARGNEFDEGIRQACEALKEEV